MKKKLIFGFAVILLLMAGAVVNAEIKRQNTTPHYTPVTTTTSPSVEDIDVSMLLKLTNEHRQAAGISPLSENNFLNDSAKEKCEDMVTRNYWGHDDPEGNKTWGFIKRHIEYVSAGENLAYGQKNAEDVVEEWIASKSHNDNLLATQFTDVGFGVCLGGNYLGKGKQVVIVQHFVAR